MGIARSKFDDRVGLHVELEFAAQASKDTLMKVFSATTEINASPEAIWAILTDAAKYTEWDPAMLRLEGTIAAGQTITIYTKAAPQRAFKPKVAEFEPNRKMVWRSGMPFGLFKGERTFVLDPLGQNRVKFSMREEFTGPMLAMIGKSIPDLTSTFEAFAAALKQRAEHA